MPFPIAIVIWGGASAILGTVVTGAVSEMRASHSAHSDYSDQAQQDENIKKDEEDKRKDELKKAKAALTKTLHEVRTAMGDNAREGRAVFEEWQLSSKDFAFKDFTAEMGKVDATSKEKISEAAERVFSEEERTRKEELDEVNAMLRRLAEKRCGGK